MAYQIPRGCQDVFGNESYKWQALEQTLRSFCYMYNYDEIRTPIFEHTEVFKRENDSSDMVNKEMYTFKLENSKTSLTLRPEGTAGVVRSFVENKMFANPDLPAKFYYMGPMSRHERPQKGRMRIFNQFGVEALGVKSPYVDVETIVLAFSILKSLGLNDIKVCLNTLGDDESRTNYRNALKEYFAPYVDELCGDCKRRYEQNPLRILDCKVDHDHECMKNAPKMSDYLNEASQEYFNTVCELLDKLEIPYEVDDKLVRGLDYYTHTVFEIVSMNKEMGAQSTVLAGGRYDGLISYFGGPEGMSDAYVMCLDKEARTYAFEVLTELRAYGYRCDMDMMERSFKGQFKAVDRSKAKLAILIGKSELDGKKVTVKNIAHKEQETIDVEKLIPYVDGILEEESHHHHEHEGE